MNFKIHDKLIEEAESAQGLLYRMITAYVCGATAIILILTLTMGSVSRLNFYFFINACTISLLTWFIRKSFHIKSEEKYIASFRIALFLLLNSSLASLTGGVEILDRDTTSLIAAVLYAPAMFIIVLSFKRFIKYINNNYKAAIDLSLTDELTGLPNRRHLNMKLSELDAKYGTLCIIDIDHFKKINDSYGHDFGDITLKNIGLQLSHFLSKDIFISRSGGEEFAVIIFNNMAAEAVINEIKDSVSCKDGNGETITLSIGAAVKQMNSSSSYALAAADKALYRAKRSGRDRIVYA